MKEHYPLNKAWHVLDDIERSADSIPIGMESARAAWLRHGLVEAALVDIYLDHYPDTLSKDEDYFGETLKREDVLLGVLLHDAAGKPYVTDDVRIWLTNAKVKDTELENLIGHPRIGFEKLVASQEAGYLQDLHPVVGVIIDMHHEKLNGTGPNDEPGSNIPHIVRVVTAIDQIVSRQYKKAYHENSFDLAGAMIDVSKKAGIEYDEQILFQLHQVLLTNQHMNNTKTRWLGRYI